jgi:hypothetical protein
VSLLTLYRPNFCAACGDKIVRLRWHVWTSRRFCKSCTPQFRKQNWLQPILVSVALLTFGFVVGRVMRQTPPPLIIQRNLVTASSPGNQTPPQVLIDDAYICGARTKKGTACSRRVHGQVRCWQHKGMPAMLPLEKLKIKE